MSDRIPVRRALLSVSNKHGLTELGHQLASRGVQLISTGGTASTLRNASLDVTDVSELTGFPEMMDGRVKTLHPKVHGGLLALRDNPEHLSSMEAHGIDEIDLLIVNLYPFEDTVASGAGYESCVENIDIGGPAMIRAAAKNHAFVTVVVDPQDYPDLIDQIDQGGPDQTYRKQMALTAYARTAAYDSAVSTWLAGALNTPAPRRQSFAGTLVQRLRYGENPHQAASFYTDGSDRPGVATARQHQGKALSYNNINDTDAAFELVSSFDPSEAAACAIIKHANPCGVASAATLIEAYQAAFDCDRTSAFGGIVALNQTLDRATAEAITGILTEVVVAPDADADAIKIFAAKKNLRLLTTGGLADAACAGMVFRQVSGGFLVQDRDSGQIGSADLRTVTKRTPTEQELSDLLFAWKVAKHVKSNAIVYAKNGATVGIGAGQMSRLDSSTIAATKAARMTAELGLSESPAIGSVVASDAFFPFADGLLAAAAAGATAVIQPGGSVRDKEVIAAADDAGLAMVFTGMRHFLH